jgi:peptidyl-dipeptidase Dcp
MPSQVMENWVLEPEVLAVYAKHYKTGAPIPAALVERVQQARKFNQGFATVEYLAASYLDMDWHTLTAAPDLDALAFERQALGRIGLPEAIPSRYRTPYFQHIFAGGYSAGYYGYIWSEVLDADIYQLFKERGIFDPATALSFRRNILEPGNGAEALELFKRFRGREPSVDALLERRGLK